MKLLILMRGLPGEGKSTICKDLGLPVCSADLYFETQDGYKFDPNNLYKAHESCYNLARQLSSSGASFIVDNTNTTWKECKRYVELGVEFGYCVIPLEPHRDIPNVCGRNVHGVPQEKWDQMKERYVPNYEIVKRMLNV